VYCHGGDLYIQSSNTGFGVSKGLGLITDGNSDKYIWNYENTSLRFATNSTERMRIDSSGNLLIGSTSTLLQTAKVRITHTSPSLIEFYHSGGPFTTYSYGTGGFSAAGYIGSANQLISGAPSSNFALRAQGHLCFAINNLEKARVENNGNFLVGKTATFFGSQGVELRNHGEVVITRTAGEALVLRRNTSNGQLASFRNTAGTTVGTIVTGSSSTAYNTSSDYRLKDNVVDLTAAISRLKTLPVHRFNFITDSETTVDGFIAHEAQLVVPEAVTGVKDEVNDDGDPVYQGIDQAKLVPLLTAALQETITKIETLEDDKYTFNNSVTFKQPTSLLDNPFASFLNSNGDTAGAIIQSGVNSVTYATSSDYRLKDNVVELTAAIPRLKQLAPKRFNFKADADVTVDGFLAHEAQVVVPEAVTGTHNQLDGDGNAIYQGIDQSKLVPLLTAALQEAIGRIETLETEVATLKGG